MNSTTHWKIAGIAATLVIILSLPLYHFRINRQTAIDRAGQAAAFVGSAKCAQCHKIEYDRFKGSPHDLAMDEAAETTVLGDFNNAEFRHFGRQTLFYRQGNKFMVHTQGPGGVDGDFEIRYVFGVYPLQQYLIPFPGGRLQCLPLAWDAREKRWYHLYPDGPLDSNDWLYWTNRGQNWNGMCAECHSTNLQKNYDPETDSYQTTWSEIDVGCEACHGPGGRHVAWAELPAMARPQEVENHELTVQTNQITARDQVRLCAPCHSRRTILGDYTHQEKDLLDSLLPVSLRQGLYYADGQILDEVYVYGSFTQSRMYQRQVRCGDCHDVHSLKTVKPGNELCLTCHRAADYDTPAHHFHKREGEPGEPIRDRHGRVLFAVGSGSQCVGCHMPGHNYMVVDYRPDHGLRRPRPDLSLTIGVPNACNRCHGDKTPAWADDTMAKWYGPGRTEHYGTILAAGRQGLPQARTKLISLALDPLYPVIVRATALDLLRSYPGEDTQQALEAALSDPESMIRRAAVDRADLLPPAQVQKLLTGMLHDPVAAVRLEAAYQITARPGFAPDQNQSPVFRSGLLEYLSAMKYSADFAFARFNLGNLYDHLKNTDQAIEQYRAAIKIDDQFYLAQVNLAMLYNRLGRNDEAEKLLRQALTVRADLPEVRYSLGLLLAEEKRFAEAAEHLDLAARGLPDYARVYYNLGQILDYLREDQRAQAALERAFQLEPDQKDYLKALLQHYLRHRKYGPIKNLAENMIARDPDSRLAREILQLIGSQPNRTEDPAADPTGQQGPVPKTGQPKP